MTDLEQLEEFRKSKADVTEVYDFMQEHLSKFGSKLSLCFKYMVDVLGMEEQQANNTLEFWCDEWGFKMFTLSQRVALQKSIFEKFKGRKAELEELEKRKEMKENDEIRGIQ